MTGIVEGQIVRNTQEFSNTVSLVVEAIGKCMVGSSLEEQAIAALEACRYADLVAELAEVAEVAKGCAKREHQYFSERKELLLALKRSRIALNLVPANDKRFNPSNHAKIKVVTDIIDEALAKIKGLPSAGRRHRPERFA